MIKHANKHVPSPSVSEGIIDKISLTFTDYPKDQIGFYQSFAIDLCNDGQALQLFTLKNGYKLNLRFAFADSGSDSNYGGIVLLSLMPTKKGIAQMRAEFNPATLGPTGVKQFVYEFCEFFLSDGYAEFYQRARVSRLDIAFDIFGVNINDAHFWSNTLKVSEKYNGVGGRVETLILGSQKGRSTVIYDKAAQLLKTKGIAINEPRTRVEARLKYCCALKNLLNLRNPLKDFQLSHMAPPESLDKDLWLLFNAYTHTKTTNAALQSLSSSKIKNALKAALKDQSVVYLDSDAMWAKWPDIVNASGLFDYFGQQAHVHLM